MYNKVMQEKIFKGVQNAEVNGMRPQGVGESTGLFVRGERLLPSPSDDEQDDNGDNSKGGSWSLGVVDFGFSFAFVCLNYYCIVVGGYDLVILGQTPYSKL